MTRIATAIALLAWTVALPHGAPAQGMGLEELKREMDWGTGSLVLLDKLEYGAGAEGRPLILEGVGWWGGAYDRVWFRVEGDQRTTDTEGGAEGHVYYGRLISPWWDALVGARVDGRWGEAGDVRAHLAVGVVGLAPLRFELSPTLFVSHEGDVSARLEAEYQVLLTQRLVVEPELELNAALQDVPEWGVGSGLSELELGLRVRYEIVKEVAPYVGVVWTRSFGDTADLARAAGEPVGDLALVVGLRLWR